MSLAALLCNFAKKKGAMDSVCTRANYQPWIVSLTNQSCPVAYTTSGYQEINKRAEYNQTSQKSGVDTSAEAGSNDQGTDYEDQEDTSRRRTTQGHGAKYVKSSHVGPEEGCWWKHGTPGPSVPSTRLTPRRRCALLRVFTVVTCQRHVSLSAGTLNTGMRRLAV